MTHELEFLAHAKPDHPDAERFTNLMNEMVGSMKGLNKAGQERLWEATVEKFVHRGSLDWMVATIACRIAGVNNPLQFSLVAKTEAFQNLLLGIYDGFLTGAEFERRKHKCPES